MKSGHKNKSRLPSGGKGPKDNRPGVALRHPLNQTSQAKVIGLCLFLAILTLVVFSRTFHYGFVNYDDETYVYQNAIVQQGLTLGGIGWAFTHTTAALWHPLTMISYLLDDQLYGLNASGYHVTNVVLHAIAVVLLFLALREATGALWRSAFVAAIFAIHPLRVESVAWIAERKDELSGVFFMLTLWAYIRYVRLPFSVARYLLVNLFFALGLMCKPMLVTLPFVLLLLDAWPLKRPVRRSLLLEKIPFFLFSLGTCVGTLLAQKNAIAPVAETSLSFRLCNALVSYLAYLGQMFYPANLAVYYPLPENFPFWKVALALALLLAVSAAAFHWRRRHPYLIVGWLWYLGMLLPVIGLVQVGSQAHADRYTYLPQIGLYLALTWGVTELCSGWRHSRWALSAIALLIIGIFSLASHIQTGYWRDSESLWNRALACKYDSWVAHNNLGMSYMSQGQVDQAIEQYQQAIEIDSKAPLTHFNLGAAFAQNGELGSAIGEYQKAIQLQPDYLQARNNLGDALLRTGQTSAAIDQFQEALKLSPQSTMLRNNLAFIFLRNGRVSEAVDEFQQVLEIEPNNVDACQYLAWVFATSPDASVRDGAQAIALARKANDISGGKDPGILSTLAAAYANNGQFSDALTTAQQGLQLATNRGDSSTAAELQAEIGLCQANLPIRDTSLTNTAPMKMIH
ncbi:MAG TPA: tetratricopeptide repeat protein [Candidatus Acidoferrum sp.]|jgi:tetratricopeptide (TPR) repeat protein|nr:tetratricopeptide repeat protein [Candidatus Acidoferrum sp.]